VPHSPLPAHTQLAINLDRKAIFRAIWEACEYLTLLETVPSHTRLDIQPVARDVFICTDVRFLRRGVVWLAAVDVRNCPFA
jgi:hypothetical protein